MLYTQTQAQEKSLFRELSLVLLASFLIALSGRLSLPLWFTPVPIALQPSVILLLSVLLGSRRAVSATFAFLAQGAMGLPVFSAGSLAGIASFLGPKGGYLIGYLIASFVVGALIERCKERTALNAFFAMVAGNLVIYLFGAAYLATFIGLNRALLLGVAPFLIGDLVKIGLGLHVLRWTGWQTR